MKTHPDMLSLPVQPYALIYDTEHFYLYICIGTILHTCTSSRIFPHKNVRTSLSVYFHNTVSMSASLMLLHFSEVYQNVKFVNYLYTILGLM